MSNVSFNFIKDIKIIKIINGRSFWRNICSLHVCRLLQSIVAKKDIDVACVKKFPHFQIKLFQEEKKIVGSTLTHSLPTSVHYLLSDLFSYLTGKVIQEIGYLRLVEGLLDDADDLLQEAIELAEVIHKLPVRASVLFHIGNLR